MPSNPLVHLAWGPADAYTRFVSQLTLYLPDEVAARLEAEAQLAKKSLSAYVLERLEGSKTSTAARREAIAALYGSAEGLEATEDAPPDEPLAFDEPRPKRKRA